MPSPDHAQNGRVLADIGGLLNFGCSPNKDFLLLKLENQTVWLKWQKPSRDRNTTSYYCYHLRFRWPRLVFQRIRA
jgi:hypothetical protein